MKKTYPLLCVLSLALLFTAPLAAQQSGPGGPGQNGNQGNQQNQGNDTDQEGEGDDQLPGWDGYFSIDYKGNRFVIPYAELISITRNEYLVDGGGLVKEVTIDTKGSVIARFYYLDTILGESSLTAVQSLNQRIKDVQDSAKDKAGVEVRRVVKHYPDTTHARTVEFSLSNEGHLDEIFDYVTREWIDKRGKGSGRTLKFE